MEFSVLDTGKGIPASHIESIFEPFRQVEISDTREHGGTGLGLTISRKLVEMMGGTLRAESGVQCVGSYSRVHVCLYPLHFPIDQLKQAVFISWIEL